jgi:hypothetical protein
VPAGPTKHNATCDACQAAIVGVRFKCGNCADYDICAPCEAQNSKLIAEGKKALHESTHVFVKSTHALVSGREVLLPRVLTGDGAPRVRMCVPMACMFARRAALAAAAAAAQAQEEASKAAKVNDDDDDNESDSESDDEQQQQQQDEEAAKQAALALAAEQAVEEAQLDSAWFVGAVSREDAEQRVRGAPAGTFVVRRAASGAGYVLTVSEGDEVVHAHIVRLAGRGWTTRLTSQTMPACASVRALVDSLAPMLRFPVPVHAAAAAVADDKAAKAEAVPAPVAPAPVLNPMFASQRRQVRNCRIVRVLV